MADRRWLDRDQTAERISVHVHELPRLLRSGKLPQPSYHLGSRSPRWDSLAIDALFGAKMEPNESSLGEQAVNDILAGRYAGGQKAARGRNG